MLVDADMTEAPKSQVMSGSSLGVLLMGHCVLGRLWCLSGDRTLGGPRRPSPQEVWRTEEGVHFVEARWRVSAEEDAHNSWRLGQGLG